MSTIDPDDLARTLSEDSAFDRYYGLRLLDCSAGFIEGIVEIRPEILQPTGFVHGGVYSSVAEALASAGTNWAVTPDGLVGLGMANSTNFLRPATSGSLHAKARSRHSGRTLWVWDVDIEDDDGRSCAISRVTIAVRRAQRR